MSGGGSARARIFSALTHLAGFAIGGAAWQIGARSLRGTAAAPELLTHPTEPDACINCRFYATWHTDKVFDGVCRRHAPSGPVLGTGELFFFPPICASFWCGEYRPADGPIVGRGRDAA